MSHSSRRSPHGARSLRILPRDEKFYELFTELATRLTASASLLQELFQAPDQLASKVTAIKGLEHEADNLTHDVIDRIDRTFVTPFDREDIHELARALDDVVDLIDGAARRAAIFRIKEATSHGVTLSDVLMRSAQCIEETVAKMKDPKVVG